MSSTASDPYAVLGPAWERFKRAHRTARNELARAYREEQEELRQFRWQQAVNWDKEARLEWVAHVTRVCGSAACKWEGDSNNPRCLINNVMLFA